MDHRPCRLRPWRRGRLPESAHICQVSLAQFTLKSSAGHLGGRSRGAGSPGEERVRDTYGLHIVTHAGRKSRSGKHRGASSRLAPDKKPAVSQNSESTELHSLTYIKSLQIRALQGLHTAHCSLGLPAIAVVPG